MTRKKLSAEESVTQRQKALDRRREAGRLWRTKQLEERQAKQVQEASTSTAVTILKIESPSRNEPFETNNEDSRAEGATSCVQSVSSDGFPLKQTATRAYSVRTRKSPTLPCGSIRSSTGADLAPTASPDSGHSDVSCHHGPLRDVREPSAARNTSNTFESGTTEGETLGLEALALFNHEGNEPTPKQGVGKATEPAEQTADAPLVEQPPSEDNFTTWGEEGLFVTDWDSADDASFAIRNNL